MAKTKQFDPSKVSIIVGPQPIGGFAKGTFINVERSSHLWSKEVGADGEVSRTKSSDKSGRITLKLMASSASNDYLSALNLLDELSNGGMFPVIVKDNSGTSLYAAAEAWIEKAPNAEFSKELTEREWVIDCAILESFSGGN